MIDGYEVAEGLSFLAEAFGVRLADARVDAYTKILAPHFNRETWKATVKAASEDCERFPVPKVLLALRGSRGVPEAHQCALCETSPGWVMASSFTTKPSRGGKLRWPRSRSMQPCPKRTDTRASKFYAAAADASHLDEGEERERAEATARRLSSEEAHTLLRVVDPEQKLVSTEKAL